MRRHWLFSPLRANSGLYLMIAAASAFINLFALATSVFAMAVFDRVVPAGAVHSLLVLVIGLCAVFAFDFLLRMMRSLLGEIAGARFEHSVSAALFDRVIGGGTGGRSRTPEYALALKEVETLRDFAAPLVAGTLADLPFLLLFIGLVALIGGWIALVPLLAAVLLLIIGMGLQRLLASHAAEDALMAEARQVQVTEAITGAEAIRVSGAGAMLRARWRRLSFRRAVVAARHRRLHAVVANISGLAQNLAYAGTVALGALLVADGRLSTGGLVACSILAGRAVAPLAQVTALLARLAQARAAVERIGALLAAPASSPDVRPVRPHALGGHVALSGVHLHFAGRASAALAGIDLIVSPGERVGLIGRSGSGKSTLLRVVLGLDAPTAGMALFDGVPVSRLDLDWLYARAGVLVQSPQLFAGSIAENIALARPGVGEADIVRAAVLAGLGDWPEPITSVLATELRADGAGLSAGQRQQVALARALVLQPAMLVLDEPVSQLDRPAELRLVHRLAPWMRGRTLLLATHRPALLALCDRVIVLDGGRIVADGPRDTVLARLGPSGGLASDPEAKAAAA